MLKHLISLVFLFVALTFVKAYSDTKTVILPKPKPQGIFKSVKKAESRNILPLKKPIKEKLKLTKTKEILPQNKPLTKKEIQVEKKVEIAEEKKSITKISNNKQLVIEFLLPEKKPITYKAVVSKEAQESKVLSKKDYSYAKEVFLSISEKKWSSAFRTTKKVKDKDFKNLISWIYLKEKSNKATFSDYINFIDNNPNYPRISRLRYLAEHKINLNSNSPNTVIGWFESSPPLSGFGKIKLGESYFIKGNYDKAEKFIKDGWINASLSSKDLRYLNKKYKKFLNSSDH